MGIKRKKLLSIVRRGSSDKVQDEEPVVCLQVGKTMWENVPKSMRTELWMSVLHRRGLGMAAADKYEGLLAQDIPDEVVDTIDKDMGRTFPDIKRYASTEGQESMARILRAYAAYDPEVGYCQGMNFLAGMLLMYMPQENYAFGALVVLMYERGLRKLYDTDMSLLQVKLWQLGRLVPQDTMDHLEITGCLPVLFASSWILTSFASDFPYQVAGRILDVLMADSFDAVVLKVGLVILVKYGKEIRKRKEMESIVRFLATDIPAMRTSKLHEIVSEALATSWAPEEIAILSQTSGVETVQEAVVRVENGILSPRTEDADSQIATIKSSAAIKGRGKSRLHLVVPPVPQPTERSSGTANAVFLDNQTDPGLCPAGPSRPPMDMETSPFGPYSDGNSLGQKDLDLLDSEMGDNLTSSKSPLESLDSWAWVSAEPSPAGSRDGLCLSSPNVNGKASEEPDTEQERTRSEIKKGASFGGMEGESLSDYGWLVGVGRTRRSSRSLSGSDPKKEGFEFKWIDAVVKDMNR